MTTDTLTPDENTGTPNELGVRHVIVGGVKTSSEFAERAGKIMGIIQDKRIEAKRRVNHLTAMRLNLNNWKHGKFSLYRPLPKYFFDYAEYVTSDINLNDINQLLETFDGLIKKNLIRIEANHIFELTDGGVQDKALSTLIKDTVYLLALRHTLANPININVNQYNQFNLNSNEDTSSQEGNEALKIVRDALRALRGQ